MEPKTCSSFMHFIMDYDTLALAILSLKICSTFTRVTRSVEATLYK